MSGSDIYVGGQFTAVSSSTQNAISANRIARWSTTGSVWSRLGSTGQNGTGAGLGGIGNVQALAVSGTGLRVGGAFNTVSSNTQNAFFTPNIAKWDTTEEVWVAEVPTFGSGIRGTVNAVVDAGNFVYVGGSFTWAGSVAANNVACWDKLTHTWSALGSAAQNGTNNTVNALIVSGSDLYVGGSFTTVSSSTQLNLTANRIAKWSAASNTWSPLGSSGLNGTNNAVRAFSVIGNDLYVGGDFTTVSSSTQVNLPANRISRWDAATGIWSPLGTAGQNGTSGNVSALAARGADLYVGGSFLTVSSSTQLNFAANRIAKWDTTGNTWSALGSTAQNGTGGPVNALVVSGADIYVGGGFLTVSSNTQLNLSAKQMAKWDTTGGIWSGLGSTAQNGTGGLVNALAVSGSEIYVGGGFTTVSSSTQLNLSAKNIAKWDSTANTWSPIGSATQNGANNTVMALAVIGTDFYVGGSAALTTVSSTSQNGTLSNGFGIYGPIPVPEIVVEQPAGTALVDGTASIDFGSAAAGSAGTPLTFTIRNTGTGDLVLGTITNDGATPGDFTVSAPGSATITAGGSTTFTVTFTPSAAGARSASVHIPSTVSGAKNPFDIALTGTGTDTASPTGGTMTLTPASPMDAGGALTVSFAGWTDPSAPLTYALLVDDVVVSAQGASASRNFTGPTTPGVHTLKGRIYDTLNNATEVTQNFTVLTAQESWRQFYFGTTANTGNAADTADPDGDGHNNVFEFAAGLGPNDPASRFSVRVEAVALEPTKKAIIFRPLAAGRTYVVKYKTSLTGTTWTTLTNITTSDNGTERTVIDNTAGSGPKFYTVEIVPP